VLREVLDSPFVGRRGADALHADLPRLRDLPLCDRVGANIRLEELILLPPGLRRAVDVLIAATARSCSRSRRPRRGRDPAQPQNATPTLGIPY
jgi:hypothetical protein